MEAVAFSCLTGEVRIDSLDWKIENHADGPYLSSEFAEIGPFESRGELLMAARDAGILIGEV
jgi:hypothetical protein